MVVTGELGELGFLCLPCLPLAPGGRRFNSDGGCQVGSIWIYSLLIIFVFREGFNSVFPLASLGMFYPDELDQIFCGTVQTFTPWDFKMLSDSCKPAHGFTLESPAIVQLFEILASYNQDEQRAFLQFVTGTCLYSLVF